MVFQDGGRYVNAEQEFRVPVVFDNLIHKKEMPVTIGIFINPGHAGDGAAGRPVARSQPQLRVRHAQRAVRAVPARGDPARGRQELQASPTIPTARGDRRHELGRHLRVHRRLGAARRSSARCSATSAASRTSAAATSIPALIRKTEQRSRSASSCRTARTTSTTSTATGRWPTSRWPRRSSSAATTTSSCSATGPHGKHGGAILPDSLRWLWRDTPPPPTK